MQRIKNDLRIGESFTVGMVTLPVTGAIGGTPGPQPNAKSEIIDIEKRITNVLAGAILIDVKVI